MKKLYLFCVCFLILSASYSQQKLSFAIECGINTSGIPRQKYSRLTSQYDKVIETYKPLVRPVFGISGQYNFNKRVFTRAGLQYVQTGRKYHYHKYGKNTLYGKTYADDIWENQTFNKLSIPVCVGYNLTLKKIKTSFFVGLQKGIMLNGSYYYKKTYIEENHSRDYASEKNLNPFDKNDFTQTANKRSLGLLSGISMQISKKLSADFTLAVNTGVSYGNLYGCIGEFTGFSNGDISLKLRYSFISFK